MVRGFPDAVVTNKNNQSENQSDDIRFYFTIRVGN